MMRLWGLVAVGMLFAVGACNMVDDGCGPFKDKFRTTDFATATARLDDLSPEAGLRLSAIAGDTLAPGELAIQMLPVQEHYFSETSGRGAFRFVAVAYACSPVIPTSDEVITGIQVFSDTPFGPGYAVGDDLARLFDVVVLDRAAGGYQRFDLETFLAQAPNAVDELVLVLKAPPAATSGFRFTVKYSQTGSGLGMFEFVTDAVVLKSTG